MIPRVNSSTLRWWYPHTVNGVFNDIAELLPRFIKTHRRDNGQPAVAIHDWNVSYIEKGNDASAVVYFTNQAQV